AVLRPGGARGEVREPPPQPDEAVEAVADRYQSAGQVWRIYRSARDDAVGHAHRLCAMDAGQFQRPAARPADLAARPTRPSTRPRAATGGDSLAAASPSAGQGALWRP